MQSNSCGPKAANLFKVEGGVPRVGFQSYERPVSQLLS